MSTEEALQRSHLPLTTGAQTHFPLAFPPPVLAGRVSSRENAQRLRERLVLPDDGVGAVAAWYGRGLLPRRPQNLQRRVDVHFCRVFNGELHHL